MMQVYNKKQECYGCSKCKQVCPVQAIRMERDEEGFLYPVVDEGKCIYCGKCEEACIIHIEKEKKEETTVAYACSALDEEILSRSTSGGMFYLLACAILAKGGVVYGATYRDGKVEHIRVEKIEDLRQLQGTRYVQSTMENVLPQIEEDIKQSKYLLVSGTPCQIAAVKSLYGELTDKLLLVELFCMGVPSPQVWEDYIAEKEAEWGKIENVNFRDKRTGWNSSSVVYSSETQEQVFSHGMDLFINGFFQSLYMRKSCHECRFKGENTVGDLKIGDFWGSAHFDERYKVSKGTSVVVVETEVGKQWLEMIGEQIQKEEIPYRFVKVYNPYVEVSRKPSKSRAEFFETYKQGEQKISEMISQHLNPRFSPEQRKILQYPVVEGFLQVKNAGRSTADFFQKKGWKRIAVYGLGEMGKYLLQDLEGSEIKIDCIVDKNFTRFPKQYKGMDVIGPHELCERDYDGIVVSVVQSYNSILEVLLVQGVDLNKIVLISALF